VRPELGDKAPIKAFLRRSAVWWAFGSAVLFALSIIVTTALYRHPRLATRPGAIAILPFQNVSARPDLDYLRSALPDEVANHLERGALLDYSADTDRRHLLRPDCRLARGGTPTGC
jgi:hypothetical protein